MTENKSRVAIVGAGSRTAVSLIRQLEPNFITQVELNGNMNAYDEITMIKHINSFNTALEKATVINETKKSIMQGKCPSCKTKLRKGARTKATNYVRSRFCVNCKEEYGEIFEKLYQK